MKDITIIITCFIGSMTFLINYFIKPYYQDIKNMSNEWQKICNRIKQLIYNKTSIIIVGKLNEFNTNFKFSTDNIKMLEDEMKIRSVDIFMLKFYREFYFRRLYDYISLANIIVSMENNCNCIIKGSNIEYTRFWLSVLTDLKNRGVEGN